MVGKPGNDLKERIKIQEKAAAELADTVKKRVSEFDEKMEDVREELKALKLFLSRAMPDFKKQFPNIRRKIKAA